MHAPDCSIYAVYRRVLGEAHQVQVERWVSKVGRYGPHCTAAAVQRPRLQDEDKARSTQHRWAAFSFFSFGICLHVAPYRRTQDFTVEGFTGVDLGIYKSARDLGDGSSPVEFRDKASPGQSVGKGSKGTLS